MSETFFVNVSAPGCVIGWIRRWIAGSSGMEGTMVGTAEDPGGRRDVGCCECLLGPLWAGSSRSSFIICQGNSKGGAGNGMDVDFLTRNCPFRCGQASYPVFYVMRENLPPKESDTT